MSIQSIIANDLYVEVGMGDGTAHRVTAADFNGNLTKVGNDMTVALQALIDVETPLTDLPADDIDKTVDPNNSYEFFRNRQAVTYFVFRSNIVVSIVWNGLIWNPSFKDPGV